MSDRPARGWLEHGLRAVLLLLGIAVGVQITATLLEPFVGGIVGLAVVLGVLRVAIGRRHL